MKIKWHKIYKNKYLLAIIVFILIVLFFDDNNLLERFDLLSEKSEIEAQIDFYDKEIQESNRKYHELKTDATNLEKFAREEFFMKKKDEDIYIIVEKEE